jgi:large subunit ribosomal protein L5
MAEKRDYVPKMKAHYQNVVRKSLIEAFKYDNPMAVPRLEKIVINVGVGEAVGDSKKVAAACEDLAAITGQKPVVTRAKKSKRA